MSSNAPNPPLPETLAELIRYNRERFGEYVSLIYESPGQDAPIPIWRWTARQTNWRTP
jgi:hypothetical protein